MKKKTKAAPIEVLQLLILELRSLMTLTKEKIRAAKARVRKSGPRKPRQLEAVPGKFLKALKHETS
jgi:hypothetical protein